MKDGRQKIGGPGGCWRRRERLRDGSGGLGSGGETRQHQSANDNYLSNLPQPKRQLEMGG